MKAMTHIAKDCQVCLNQIKPIPEWSVPRNKILKKINFPEVVWNGASCSICHKSPLVGNAFKCFECERVISCESCSDTGKHAHDLHYLSSELTIKARLVEMGPTSLYQRHFQNIVLLFI